MHPVSRLPGLAAFWDFQEKVDGAYSSVGPQPILLRECGGVVPEVDDGYFGSHAPSFGAGPWLEAPRNESPKLNIHGADAQVSVIAWIKREACPSGEEDLCQAIAGMWNEHAKRQYCMFLNLVLLEGRERLCGHISSIGGATPGYKYCMDAAVGESLVPIGRWLMAAISYDGVHIRSWLNGRVDDHGERNPYYYPGGIFDGGPEGADFTVGAVARPDHVELVDGKSIGTGHVQSNLFHGLLGGLAVFNRALDAREIAMLANL